MTDLRIVIRSLLSRLFSSITTIITVGVAVALLLVLQSLQKAGEDAFQRGSGNMHLYVSADSSPLTSILNGLFYANAPPRYITWEKAKSLRAGFPYAWTIATQQGDSYKGFPTLAADPEIFEKFEPVRRQPWRLAEGSFLKRAAPGEPFQLVAGSAAAKGAHLKIGDSIHLTHGSGGSREDGGEIGHVHEEYNFKVVGILEPTGSAHDRALFTDIEAGWILHAHDRREREEHARDEAAAKAAGAGQGANTPAKGQGESAEEPEPLVTAKDLTDDDRRITGIMVRLPTRADSDVAASAQQVYDMLRRDTAITVADPGNEIRKLMSIVQNIDALFLAMGIVVLISSGIAIMLALYNSMAARRRQIALLRVLGVSQMRVFGMVLMESAFLGLLGAVLGILVSLAGAIAATLYLKSRLGLVIDPTLDPPTTLFVAAGAVVLALLAGLIPAINAYRTPVVRNLRPLG